MIYKILVGLLVIDIWLFIHTLLSYTNEGDNHGQEDSKDNRTEGNTEEIEADKVIAQDGSR